MYPYTQWLMIIIPTKWLQLGVYPIFRHTHMTVGLNICRPLKNWGILWVPSSAPLGSQGSEAPRFQRQSFLQLVALRVAVLGHELVGLARLPAFFDAEFLLWFIMVL